MHNNILDKSYMQNIDRLLSNNIELFLSIISSTSNNIILVDLYASISSDHNINRYMIIHLHPKIQGL